MTYALLLCGTCAAALWNSEIREVRLISRAALISILLYALVNWGAW
jgi:hypothetical protein